MVNKKKSKGQAPAQQVIQQTITRFFKQHPRKAYNAKQLIRKLDLSSNRDAVFHALTKLVDNNVITPAFEDKFRLAGKAASSRPEKAPRSKEPLIGSVDLTRSGAAFISVPGLERDVFIPPHAVNTALQGDTVEVRLRQSRRGGRPEGEIVSIVKRLNDNFIGTIRLSRKHGILVPDKLNVSFDILIGLDDLAGAKDGEKVVVQVTEWPGPDKKMRNPRGIVTGRLNDQSINDVEMQAILVHNGFQLYFGKEALAVANAFPSRIPEEEAKHRRDFRDILTFTIDPEDAKDFDDALSYRALEDGGCEVGVHIADVTHYLQQDSALDQEAYERSTSVYLVDRVLPMLPERLSNELCSLRPDEDSLTFSAVFTFDSQDKLIDRWFGKTIIHSHRRFSYEDAQEVLDSKSGDHVEELLHVNRIATKLRKQRFKDGSISFESEEVKFRLNEDGVPIEVYTKERKEAHLLIEDFMLLANKEVAAFIQKKSEGQEIPFVYRVHDLPDPDKLNDFVLFAKEVGFKMEVKTPEQVARSFNKLAEASKENEMLRMLEPLAIRTMAKAAYTTKNIGHYGLGFADYTHFTSPIRRYSDVLVHRILAKNLDGVWRVDKALLEAKCLHISQQERRAMDAERESIKYKQVEFIEKHVGEIFEGQISGMMDKGIFVQLKGSLVEGMAPFSNFPEPFEVDDSRLKTRGKHSGTVLKMGDTINVQIMRADLAQRQVEMRVIWE
ncbi:MAG: ribonuclease R [Saprospiraceae bacterium]|nr:ribonuclease R [Saprospiraceae bacterium]